MLRNMAMWILVIGSMGIVLAMGFSVVQSSIDLCDCSLYDEDEDDDDDGEAGEDE